MTAYTVPAYFEHGQYPNAVDLNTLSTAQVHLDELLSDNVQHPMAFYNTSDSVQRWIVLTHTYRYLHYATDGSEARIMPYSLSYSGGEGGNWATESWISENSVNLGETNGNFDEISIATYDMDSISWLNYGDQYVVYDVWGCYEYDEAHPPIEATPPFISGNFLSASALNSMSRNIEVLKGRTDAPVRPRLRETNDRWLFKRLTSSLRIIGSIDGGTVNSVAIKISNNPGAMGTAVATLTNGGSGYADGAAFDSGLISLSAYTLGSDYLVSAEPDGAGVLFVNQIYQTDAT